MDEKILVDEFQERLPAGYSMGMESPNLLVLLRPDGSVVKRFLFHEPHSAGYCGSRRGGPALVWEQSGEWGTLFRRE